MATQEFLISAFSSLLTASIHTILYEREIYPRETFMAARFHNYPVRQNRHPLVCQWVSDAVQAVADQLYLGTVARVVVVIYSPMQNPLERFIFDVERFPVVPKKERETPIEREPNPKGKGKAPQVQEPERPKTKAEQEAEFDKLHERVSVEMSESFRAVLARLDSVESRLKPLPKNCTFSVAIELKDESDAPIGHPQPWVPSEPSLQISGKSTDHSGKKVGQDIGGENTTPLRSVNAGEMTFELWVEESKDKMEKDFGLQEDDQDKQGAEEGDTEEDYFE